MQFYRKSTAISTVAQTTLPLPALPIQQANQQACTAWYVIVMGTQHIPAQRWPPPLKNSKSHHHPATTRAFLTTNLSFIELKGKSFSRLKMPILSCVQQVQRRPSGVGLPQPHLTPSQLTNTIFVHLYNSLMTNQTRLLYQS